MNRQHLGNHTLFSYLEFGMVVRVDIWLTRTCGHLLNICDDTFVVVLS